MYHLKTPNTLPSQPFGYSNCFYFCTSELVSEDGSGASRPAETDFDRYRGRDAHRAEDQPSEAKRTRSSMSTLTRGGRGAGRPTRARVRERAGRGKEVNSLTKRHQSLIREVKEASARRSWKDVLAAKEGARSRGLQLDGRCVLWGGGSGFY